MELIPIYAKSTLRALRTKFLFTQDEAASRLGISVPTLRAWETDSSDLSRKQMKAIEETYATPEDFIFFGPESTFSELMRTGTD